ncbi:MAG TPA: phytoene desaturase family protein [Longimicrobium sp.]|jgi:phytoene desaturase|uniref:phytoene desaturase family protein n=1 Tax=Longimicrobium sp. TaxID=2029185 RepID=UPI002EDACBC9
MKTQHAVVVGAGFGGMAAAIRLRARGYRVTMVEGMDQPGGRAAVFRRDGFTFDAGPTVITAPYLLQELFSLVGRDWRDYFDLMPVDPFYRVEFADGSRFDYVGDEKRLLEQIHAMSPGDVEGYRRLAAHAERIFDVGYTRLSDVPFSRVSDMLRVVPEMLRLGNHKSVYGQVAEYIQDERLRQVFSFEPLLVGGNPFRITSIYLLIHWLERKWGVWFGRGGTTSIVAGMARLMEEIGIDVRLSTPAEQIEVQGGRAVAVHAGGQRIAADVVVANADPTHVYGQLIPAERRNLRTRAALATRQYSMGLFVGYFGTRRTYPELAHHTILMGPRYKEHLRDIFDRKVLADDFSLYLHAPTRSDPSLAPPGHECFYVLSPVPNLQAGIDWEREGGPYFDRILEALEHRYLPGLRENIVTQFHVTPTYFRDTLRSTHGAGFGIEPRLTQSAYFRYHNQSPHVGGLFFVGAGTHPGAGVPGVLSTAKVLDRVVPAPLHVHPVPAAATGARAAVEVPA